MQKIIDQFLMFSGTFNWVEDQFGFDPHQNWKNPGFVQEDKNPVVCTSWDDGINFCNWLSKKEGLPFAYDIKTGDLLDENGNATTDISKVKGYRLPTEAEWEYAARQRGNDVRFGNGKNIARSSEINFRANHGDYEYLELGEYRRKTTAVDRFPSNSLGLLDMCGNAWEWVSDTYGSYPKADQVNPYFIGGIKRIVRGGRWGGDASSARVFARDIYERNSRCNNSGFRVAKSQ